jgi:hypothetical protein
MIDEKSWSNIKLLNRFAVALGGFLIFVGIIIIGIFLINFLGVIDYSLIETESLQNLFIWLFLVLGLIDLVAGFILWKK